MRVLEFRRDLDRDPWRDVFGVLFDSPSENEAARHDVESYVAVYHFKSFLLCRSYIVSARCIRSEGRARLDDLDHYVIHLMLNGDVFFTVGSARIRLRARDIAILDLSRSAQMGFRRAESISLILPRAELKTSDREILRHGRRLVRSAPVGSVLARHLIALSEEASRLSEMEATILAEATREMILTCLGLAPATGPDVAMPARRELADQVRSYIEQHLRRRSLGPKDIAENLGLSRSQLYRQFERFGGVGRYIQSRRLRRSFIEICTPRQSHRRIGEIAYSLGFEDEAYFSRAFRRAFGLSPRAARASVGRNTAYAGAAEKRPSFAQWLTELSVS